MLSAGWPSRCVVGTYGYGDSQRTVFDGLLRTPFAYLPYHPTWPGFAVNTVFYAVVLYLVTVGPFALRRLLRIHRGLCPKCSYPAGTSPVCTECGAALPRALTRKA